MTTELSVIEKQPLFTNPRVVCTRTTLELPPNLDIEEWMEVGSRLQLMGRAVNWWIGDWILYGEHHFGEMYSQALEVTDYEQSYLQNMVYTSRAYPPEERRDTLPWSHHMVAASLPPKERDAVLDMAEEEGWNKARTHQEVLRVKGQPVFHVKEQQEMLGNGVDSYNDQHALEQVQTWSEEHQDIFLRCQLYVWQSRIGVREGWGERRYSIFAKPGDDIEAYRQAWKEIAE